MRRVQLFAAARQRVGCSEIEVHLPPSACVADLRAALAKQFPPLAELLPHARIAVNAEYALDDALLPANSEIALIPPVSGG